MILKKWSVLLLVLLFTMIIGFYLLRLYSFDRSPKPLQKLTFRFETVDGRIVTDENLRKPNRCSFVLVADPDCDLCLQEIRGITGMISGQPINLMIISESTSTQNRYLSQELAHLPISQIFVVTDSKGKAAIFFGGHVCPSTFLYDSNGILINSWQGQVSNRALRKAISIINGYHEHQAN